MGHPELRDVRDGLSFASWACGDEVHARVSDFEFVTTDDADVPCSRRRSSVAAMDMGRLAKPRAYHGGAWATALRECSPVSVGNVAVLCAIAAVGMAVAAGNRQDCCRERGGTQRQVGEGNDGTRLRREHQPGSRNGSTALSDIRRWLPPLLRKPSMAIETARRQGSPTPAARYGDSVEHAYRELVQFVRHSHDH